MSDRIAIMGAGFSGLTAAWALLKSGFSNIDIYDRADRAGGLLGTSKGSHGLIESAANGILAAGEVEELCQAIGLEILSTKKESRKRYIYRNGRPRRWPLSWTGSLKLGTGMIRLALGGASARDESLASWADRELGVEAREFLVSPALRGIYACSAEELSASFILEKLKTAKRGRYRGTIGFEFGMQQLVDRLRSWLEQEGVRFHFGHSGGRPECDRLLVATSRPHAAQFVEDRELAGAMRSSHMHSLATTTIFCRKKLIDGFGCLFPDAESPVAMGVLQNDQIFENRVDSGWHSEAWITKPLENVDILLNERKRLFPHATSVELGATQTRNEALPSYDLTWRSHCDQADWIDPKLAFTGNYISGIGLTKILQWNLKIGETWKNSSHS